MQLVRLLPPLDPGKPGDGGVVPDGSIVRNVAAKRAVTLGGLPAVLLQLAHPMVAQGVSDYSDFERDPLARMISTLDATLVMTSYYQDMLGRLVVGPMARDIAAAIFAARLGPVPVSPLGPVIAAALLPGERMRQAYRLRWGWRDPAAVNRKRGAGHYHQRAA